jgi:hypothetical protein
MAVGGTPGLVAAVLLAENLVLALLAAVAGLTTIPARIGARRPVAEILQSETA